MSIVMRSAVRSTKRWSWRCRLWPMQLDPRGREQAVLSPMAGSLQCKKSGVTRRSDVDVLAVHPLRTRMFVCGSSKG